MMTIAKIAGALLAAAGLAALIGFGVTARNDEEYAKAAVLLERNPGNVLYEAKFGGAQIKRAFLISASAGGGLLALNGVTLFLVGVVGARRSQPG
jgi:hypothetical protein